MRLRDLFTSRPEEPAKPAAPEMSEEHRQLLARASTLVAASDAAIERALSTDSEAFLLSNRQEGGE